MLKKRIDILMEANVISNTCGLYVINIIDELEKESFEQSKMEMFTTHLAMATERIIRNDGVDNLNDEIWNEVASNIHFNDAIKLYEIITRNAPIEFPEEEKRFLLMHLCNLYND